MFTVPLICIYVFLQSTSRESFGPQPKNYTNIYPAKLFFFETFPKVENVSDNHRSLHTPSGTPKKSNKLAATQRLCLGLVDLQ